MNRLTCFAFCLVVFACSKNKPEEWQPPLETYTYESDGFFVNTQTPIPNVQIDCYTGAINDPPNQTLFSTGYTDSSGKYMATREQRIKVQTGRVVMHKPGYKLSSYRGLGGVNYMYPVARIKARFIKVNPYPDSVLIEYYVLPTRNSSMLYAVYPLLNENTVSLEVPGNKTYTFYRIMYRTKDCGFICQNYITGGTIPDLSLAKFGDTTITIRY